MNRLILIGNGFDLAHEMKTSYCDFLSDYMANAINEFYNNKLYDDVLLTIFYKYPGHTFKNFPLISPGTAFKEYENLINNSYVDAKFKSKFIADSINNASTVQWVDLENDYFNKLTDCKNSKGFDGKNVVKLNDEFEYLKSKLEQYLIKIQNDSDILVSEKLGNLFTDLIQGNDICTVKLEDTYPQKIMFLSFNYTDTIEKYITFCDILVPVEINYIHGKLESKDNPLIFGFGDEHNKHYMEFEELSNKELLRHIKSFGYFQTSNYHNLIRFLQEDDFQVCIFGHSLGLSDRTMLKEIFEHNKCLSIKIYYHNTRKDFTDKSYDISAHVKDKGVLRKKIVSFDRCDPMPQPHSK